MQYFEFIAARADTGAVLPLARVTVRLANTATLASLYDRSGTALPNPLTGADTGLVGFAAPNGSYDIVVASADTAYTGPIVHSVQFYDLSQLDAKVAAAAVAADWAEKATAPGGAGTKSAKTWAAEAAASAGTANFRDAVTASASKPALADADVFAILDSGNGNAPRKINFADLKNVIKSVVGEQTFLASLPSGAIGVWSAGRYQSSPRPVVRNMVSNAAISPTLYVAPRRLFGSTFYERNAVTAADSAAIARDGTNSAATLACGASWYIGTSPITLPAGTYTFCFDYACNTSFKAGVDFSGGDTLAATGGSIMRAKVTRTVAAGAHQFIIVNNGTTGNFTCLDNFHVFAGSEDLMPAGETLGAHLYLGANAFDTKPSYSAGLVDYSAGGYGLIQLPAATSLGSFTSVQIATRTALGADYQALMSKLQNYQEFTPYLVNTEAAQVAYGGAERFSVTNGAGPGLWFQQGSGLHMMSHTYNGATFNIYLDNMLWHSVNVTLSAVTVADLFSGAVNSTGFTTGAKWAGIGLWNRALSLAEIGQVFSAFKTEIALTGNVLDTAKYFLIPEGDSITARSGSYAQRYGANATPKIWGRGFAVGGATLKPNGGNSLVERLPALQAFIDTLPADARITVPCLIGANDLFQYAGGGAQYGPDVQSLWVAPLRAKGPRVKVVMGTVLPRSDLTGSGGALSPAQVTTHNTQRAAYNTIVRSWTGSGISDGTMDFAANATIGPDAASNNTTLFPDNLHPGPPAQVIMESPVARPVLNSVTAL